MKEEYNLSLIQLEEGKIYQGKRFSSAKYKVEEAALLVSPSGCNFYGEAGAEYKPNEKHFRELIETKKIKLYETVCAYNDGSVTVQWINEDYVCDGLDYSFKTGEVRLVEVPK